MLDTNMDDPTVKGMDPAPTHMCLHKLIAKEFSQGIRAMLGFDGCSTSLLAYFPWIVFLGLYLSAVMRYRRWGFQAYYKTHPLPRTYSRLSRVSWEAIIALVLTIPRLHWVFKSALDAVFIHDAWQNFNFSSPLCWGLVIYMLVFDILSQRYTSKKMLGRYYARKQRESELVDVGTVLLEGRDEKVAATVEDKAASDIEKAPLLSESEQAEEQPAPRTWFQRLRARLDKNRKIEPTAAQVLVQYHMLALVRAISAYVFFSEMALSTCSLKPERMFDSQSSIAPAMIVIGGFCLWRFGQALGMGMTFAREEVDWQKIERESS